MMRGKSSTSKVGMMNSSVQQKYTRLRTKIIVDGLGNPKKSQDAI